MGWLAETWRRVRWLGRRAAVERDLDDELRFHLEQQTAKNIGLGMAPDQARRRALVQFGALERAREQTRDEFRSSPLEDCARDVRYAVRSLRRAPAFTVVAVLTLALGMGATTAVFTVVNGVLIKPLPYPDADALIDLRHLAPGLDVPGGTINLSHTQFFTYREHGRSFQQLGLWQAGTATVTTDNEARQVRSLFVTEGTLDALGIPPAIGRWFTRADDSPLAPETAVLTYGYWQQHYGGDPDVVGRDLIVDARVRRIIGVMPAAFRFLDEAPEVILPFRFDPARLVLGQFNYRGIARLKTGTTMADATADASRMIPMWLHAWPPPPGAALAVFEGAHFTPAFRPLKEHVVGDVGRVLWLLLGTVGIVLATACANVANLLLVRADARLQDMAVRSALGASHGRIIRARLIESIVLGLGGGAAGLVLAFAGVRFILAAAPQGLPRLDDIAIDPPVLAFTFGTSLVSAVVFGLLPSLRRANPALASELQGHGRTASHSRERRLARNALVVAQVSMATVLLVSSGLMIRSFVALTRVDPGFTDPAQVQIVRVAMTSAVEADPQQAFRTQIAIRERLAAIPGVTSVSFSSAAPMQPANAGDPLFVEGRTYEPGQLPAIRVFKFVAPGHFDTVGTRIVAGRDITWNDIQSGLPVVVLSESLARELWGAPTSALGARVRENPDGGVWREVVGVVADVYDDGLHVSAPTTVYWPAMMERFWGNPVFTRQAVTFGLRSSRTGTDSLPIDIRTAVQAADRSLPVAQIETLGDLYERALAPTSFALTLLAIAGTMALLVAVVGVYGVLSYGVAQRRREIGIRVALGASNSGLRAMVVRDGLLLAGIGVGGGLVVAGTLTHVMTSLLFGVSTRDPMTYIATAAVLVVAAALASYIPARRATTVDPIEALRNS